MPDYYSILGVARTATADEIKRAYRRLASQHHPDKGGDTKRFQEIQTAYDVLGDAQKRADYDSPSPFKTRADGGWQQAQQPFDFNSIFEMFGARYPEGFQQRSMRISLWISLRDVAQGGPRPVSIATAQGQNNIEINIPPGIEDGDTVRYARLGPGGTDLLVQFRVTPDSKWTRQGEHVVCERAVNFWDLILGTDIEVTTIMDNTVVVSVPAMTAPSTMLRLRGHGLPKKNVPQQRGDLLIRIQAELPLNIPKELKEHIAQIRGH